MALYKKDHFTKEDIRLARYAKALAHPARIAILRHLASSDSCCFNELSREVPLADSTVSQHMTELKDAGLVLDTYDPPRVKYCINHEIWKAAGKSLREFTRIKVAKNE